MGTDLKSKMSKADERRFFKMTQDRFEFRLKEALVEVRKQPPESRDWSQVQQVLTAHYHFLVQEPGALILPVPKRRSLP